MEGSSTNVYPYRGLCCRGYTEPEGNLCRVLWYNSHRTHKSVGCCIQSCQGILCGVPDLLQNSQKCRVLWCNCHRTHRSIGQCGATVTELTEVVCGVTTDGNYPRYRSVGTLQNLSVSIHIPLIMGGTHMTKCTYLYTARVRSARAVVYLSLIHIWTLPTKA